MSIKHNNTTGTFKHDRNLADIIEDDESGLVIPKAARGKRKEIVDPTIGVNLTKKIIKSAVEQLNEEEFIQEVDPKIKDVICEEEEILDAVDVDLEDHDEDTLKLFEMFKSQAPQMTNNLNPHMEKTTHIYDESIKEMYIELGKLLKVYKSGKLPKVLNVLAGTDTKDWLGLLELSNPNEWSHNAFKQITKLFSQTISGEKIGEYYQHIVIDYVLNALDKSKKLPANVWEGLIYAAKRSRHFCIYFLKPLIDNNECDSKEMSVIATVINRVKIPSEIASYFLQLICENQHISPLRTIVVAKFISKGKALSINAIRAMFQYFMQWTGIKVEQPLMWHEALLGFVKKYGQDLTMEMRQEMYEMLLPIHSRNGISDEIKRILVETESRVEQG